VHPSLLPDFAGGMDMAVHDAVIAAKKDKSGCTIHFVTEVSHTVTMQHIVIQATTASFAVARTSSADCSRFRCSATSIVCCSLFKIRCSKTLHAVTAYMHSAESRMHIVHASTQVSSAYSTTLMHRNTNRNHMTIDLKYRQ
jgi:Formyl transferase